MSEQLMPTSNEPAATRGKDSVKRFIAIAVILCLILPFAAFMVILPCIQYSPAPRTRTKTMNNLRQLGLAIINYADTHKGLPPAVVRDRDDKPLYSWRVLILPYLEEGDLYAEFKLDEPWDSAHNLSYVQKMPSVFRSEGRLLAETAPGHTFFHVFVGKHAAFEEREVMKYPDDFKDGTSKTFLLVEGGEPVPWTKPDDILYSPDDPLPKIATVRPDGFLAVMADGSGRWVSNSVGEKTLRAAITRNGRDALGADWER